MNKLFTKIATLVLGMTMAVGVGVAVGASGKTATSVGAAASGSITDYTTITAGDYYIGATSSGTDYYLYVDGSNTSQSLAGTAVTSSSNATVFTFANVGTNQWTIKFKDNSNYLGIKTTKDNGKVQVLSSACTFTASNKNGLIRLSPGEKSVLCKNGSGTQFGNYQDTQPGVWLLPAKTLSSISLSGYTTEFTVGDTFSFGGTVTAHYSDSTTANVTSSTTFSGYNMSAAGNYTVTASYTEGVTKTATYGITVAAATTPTISLDGSSFSGFTGQSFSVTATYFNLTSAFAWSTSGSGTTTETITSTGTETDGTSTYSGTLTGEGTKVLTATGGGVAEQARPTFTITIEQTTVNITKESTSIAQGKSETLAVSHNASTVGGLTWTSNNAKVTVDSNGKVTVANDATVDSTATITATSKVDTNVSDTCTVTVTEAPLEYEVVFGTADGIAGLSDFNNTSYIIPSGVTLDNMQGDLYGKNDNTPAAIRFGKGSSIGSFDATISNDYYITSVSCNLKYYGSDTTAEFAVTPDGGEAIAKTLTSSFADYTYTIEGVQTNKITLGTTISGKRAYLSAFTICYAEYTDSSITITSKDSSGMMSGIIGDIQEVTYETARAEGLTLNWVLEDTDNIVDWETPYVEFLKTGTDATLTAQLKNGDEVLASDSVTFHTIAPLLDIKVDGTSSESYSLYEEQSITITADSSNMPSSATLVWSTDDTDEDYSTFNTSTGLFEAISEGIVEIKVDMMYKSSVIASDKLTITINPLGEPTLVVTTGSGLTSFKFGESLDTTGWTAIYTDDKGVQTDVINDLDFGSLDYIGTKALKATYLGTESNAVNVTVTNNGATCEAEVILEGSGFLSNSMPTGWSQSGAGTNYADQHSPYRLKFDGDGDKIIATVNTSASVIYATLGVKMIGGASTSSFAVTAKDSNGNSVATGTLTIAGKQNEIVNPKTTLNNPEGKTITSIEFVFTKGSNVGVGTGEISVDDSASFAPKQALAYSRYFLELTDGYCDATISSDAKTALINEFNWMLADSIDVFKAAPIVRGKGVTYESDISKALSRYINMLEDKGYKDSEFLNLGEDVINRTSVIHNGIFGFDSNSNNAIAIVVIVSVVSLTAIGGYFFLRKKREQN